MSGPADAPPEGTPGGAGTPARRAVLEGLAVAVVAGVGGYAWFAVAGPAGEDERDDLEDRRDDEQDQREDEQDDRDRDNSGPDDGDDS